jgi:4-hydroxy 2-oxovalerate aldolase
MIKSLVKLNGLVDYLYLVDSFGGVFPQDVIKIIRKIKSKTNVKLGFHGHNNLEMALANTLAAIDEGIDIIDSTITGMGRGAGNLKTELLLTTLNHKMNLKLNYDSLSNITSEFVKLQKKYNWGTSLPYMVSGAKSLPQKQVMEWVSKRFYSMNSITRALNRKNQDHVYPKFNPKETFENALIVGGGPSVDIKSKSIIDFLNINFDNTALIHASSKNSALFKDVTNKQYFCLVGNEGVRLEKVFNNLNNFTGECVLPPSPREMGTYVPNLLKSKTVELNEINFSDLNINSHLSISIQTSLLLGVKTIYLVGFDGYYGENISEQFQELFIENTNLFKAISSKIKCISLTQSKYESISQSSIYNFIK